MESLKGRDYPDRRRLVARGAPGRPRPRRPAEGRAQALRATSRSSPAGRVGLLLEKPSLRTRVLVRARASTSSAAHAVYLTGPEIGLGQREATRDIAVRPLAVPRRDHDADVRAAIVEELAEHARHPGRQRADGRDAPVPGARRRDDDPRAARRLRGRPRGVARATATTSARSLTVVCAKLGMDFVAATPPGYEPTPSRSRRRGRPEARRRSRRPARGGARARTCSTPTCGRAWARRTSASSGCATSRRYRIDAAAARRRRAGRDRPSLPARPPRRGDHRGRALRSAVCRLGPGREPAAHREGAARADRALMGGFEEHVRAALDSLPPELARRTRERRGRRRGARTPRSPTCTASSTSAEYLPAQDLDLPPTAARGLRRRSGRARAGDPDHRPPRARPLLRHRRGPSGRAGVRVNTALEAIAIASAVVGAAVIVLFFVGPWR